MMGHPLLRHLRRNLFRILLRSWNLSGDSRKKFYFPFFYAEENFFVFVSTQDANSLFRCHWKKEAREWGRNLTGRLGRFRAGGEVRTTHSCNAAEKLREFWRFRAVERWRPRKLDDTWRTIFFFLTFFSSKKKKNNNFHRNGIEAKESVKRSRVSGGEKFSRDSWVEELDIFNRFLDAR